jgi:CBS domain-containing protein
MFASEIMERNVITTEPNESISNAKAIMTENGIGSLPVVYDGKLVGVITKFDVIEMEEE